MLSQLSDKHREVEAWLQKVFAGQTVPQYEVNSRTLDILSELKRRSDHQEMANELTIQDCQRKAEEYGIEADRIGRLLERFGLTTGCLSQSGTVSLRTLVDACLILNVQQASDSYLLLAMSELARERMQLEDRQRTAQRSHEELVEKTKARLQHCTDLSRMLEGIEQNAALLGPEMEKKARQANFLQSKAREYRRSIEQLKKELTSAGVDPSIYHSTLVKKSQNVKDLKSKLHGIRAKLDSYHALPPDLSLARVKVEEVKQELATLEAELAQHIDLMHM